MVANTFMRILGAGLAFLTLTSVEAGAAQSIVFVSDRTGNKEIWRMDSDGTGLEQLTFNPGVDAEPVPSPDGEWIAYISGVGLPDRARQLQVATGGVRASSPPMRKGDRVHRSPVKLTWNSAWSRRSTSPSSSRSAHWHSGPTGSPPGPSRQYQKVA